MDPLSVVGAVAATLQLLHGLVCTVHRVSRLCRELQDVDGSTRNLRQDLDAMQFALAVTDQALRNGDSGGNEGWRNSECLDGILENASQTLSRIESIFQDLSKERKILPRLREFYRSKGYGQEISHHRLRVTTYISMLTVPVIITSRQVRLVSRNRYLRMKR